MRERTFPTERSSPRDGDVVVTREAHSRVHYTVRQVPGLVQFSTAVRDEAVGLARNFAQRSGIDMWYCEAGMYRLLEAYRPRGATRAPETSQIQSKRTG
jgi:hypothetical protein